VEDTKVVKLRLKSQTLNEIRESEKDVFNIPLGLLVDSLLKECLSSINLRKKIMKNINK